jgi:hypothetical protein
LLSIGLLHQEEKKMRKMIYLTVVQAALRFTVAAALALVLVPGLFPPFQPIIVTAAQRGMPEIEQFTINNGDPITDRHDVTFQLAVRSSDTGELQIRLSGDALTWSEWEPYRSVGNWQLAGGGGPRSLYIEVCDKAGHRVRASTSILIFVPASAVRLEPAALQLTAGGAPAVLNAAVIPGNATNKRVSWRSSNPAVAGVDESGTVSPLAPGEAVITASAVDGGYSAACRVEVRPPKVTMNTSPPVAYGDLNSDGKIDVSDAILLLRSIVGLVQLTPAQEQCADVNEDGVVNVADAIAILRHIVGLVDQFPVEPDQPGEAEPPPDDDPPPEEDEPPVSPIIKPTAKLLGATYRVQSLGTVTCNKLNVRSGPGTNSGLIGSLERDVSKFIEEIKNIDDSSCPVWYRIDYNGKTGWISANYVDLVNTLYGLDYDSQECRLALAPKSLSPGDYRIDGQYNFDRLEGGKRVPTGVSFYFLEHCPYAVLPLEQPAPDFVTAGYLASIVKQIRADSPFADERTARGFINAQQAWGLNAHYLTAHAALESAWGTSAIARDKNNILGFMAYDDSPYLSAATFINRQVIQQQIGLDCFRFNE